MTPDISAIAQQHAKQIFAQSHIPESLDEAKLAAMLANAISDAAASLRAQLDGEVERSENWKDSFHELLTHTEKVRTWFHRIAAVELNADIAAAYDDDQLREFADAETEAFAEFDAGEKTAASALERMAKAEGERDVALARCQHLIDGLDDIIGCESVDVAISIAEKTIISAPKLAPQVAQESPLNGEKLETGKQ